MANNIPNMLAHILAQQGRSTLTPEEAALMSSAAGVPPPTQVAANDPAKSSWLRSLFSRSQPPARPQTPSEAAKPAEGLAGPGSVADQIRRRREAADALGRDLSYLPEDMLPSPQPPMEPTMLAAAPTGTMSDADPYGGVSIQTRAALAKAGAEDPTGDLGDMAVGARKPAPQDGYAAKTTVRGPQSSKQEDQLVRMLVGRGMSEKEARARAKSIK